MQTDAVSLNVMADQKRAYIRANINYCVPLIIRKDIRQQGRRTRKNRCFKLSDNALIGCGVHVLIGKIATLRGLSFFH